MNKTSIKNFAVWARNKLIADITYKAGLIGVSEKGIATPLPQSRGDLQFFDIGTKEYGQIAGVEIKQRDALVRAIKNKEKDSDYKSAYKTIIEEIAYTWFNRLIAIRFMEVNDFLPARVRVLSSENTAKIEPDFVTTPFETDLNFTDKEAETIMQLKDQNRLDELFRMLFIKQCNKLHEILPRLFEETADYTELLLTVSFTDTEGIIYHLTHDIDENDFNIEKEGQVEIIGWLYQYYNIEPKDEAFALLKKNVKISKDRIPAATQLFTPDWIVRYMVENSVGRIWIEGHPNEGLKTEWKYYLEEADQEQQVYSHLEKIRTDYSKLLPEDLKVIDPCMGSGHILVYAFDVLVQIYESQGYSIRDIPKLILENNLFGLDIDDRAAQLAYFAIMMKARQYDRRIFSRNVDPKLFSIQESNGINKSQLQYLGRGMSEKDRNIAHNLLSSLVDTFSNAKEIGSIISVKTYDWDLLKKFVSCDVSGQITMNTVGIEVTQRKLLEIIEIAQVLSGKYHAVCTNPPYMGGRSLSAGLQKYVQKYYPDSKTDLFAVFIERCMELTSKNAFTAMITMHSFMFLSTYKDLRAKLLANNLISLVHLGIKAFDEIGNDVVQTASFVYRKSCEKDYISTFCRLVDCKDQQLKKEEFLRRRWITTRKTEDFWHIPSYTLAYWVSNEFISNFENHKSLDFYINTLTRHQTGDNDRFLRCWWELERSQIYKRWKFYSKGGNFRRYYGNLSMVIDWSESARNYFKVSKNSHLVNENDWYKEGITYSAVTSRGTGFRYLPEGCLYDIGGPALTVNGPLYGVLALLNSSVATYYFNVMNPSINLQTQDIKTLPAILDLSEEVDKLSYANYQLAKSDWDSNETSIDFMGFDFYEGASEGLIAKAYEHVVLKLGESSQRFMHNMETINRIFADKYMIDYNELPPLEERDNAVTCPSKRQWVVNMLSYMVGCLFGRYSLDYPDFSG